MKRLEMLRVESMTNRCFVIIDVTYTVEQAPIGVDVVSFRIEHVHEIRVDVGDWELPVDCRSIPFAEMLSMARQACRCTAATMAIRLACLNDWYESQRASSS